MGPKTHAAAGVAMLDGPRRMPSSGRLCRHIPCVPLALLSSGFGADDRTAVAEEPLSTRVHNLPWPPSVGVRACRTGRLPRAAVVVEEDDGQLFGLEQLRETRIAHRLARLQVRYQSVPIIFLGTRGLAQEWIYRFLAAARQWAVDEPAAASRIDGQPRNRALRSGPATHSASESTVRTWAYTVGLPQPENGPIRPEIWAAWRRTHPRG